MIQQVKITTHFLLLFIAMSCVINKPSLKKINEGEYCYKYNITSIEVILKNNESYTLYPTVDVQKCINLDVLLNNFKSEKKLDLSSLEKDIFRLNIYPTFDRPRTFFFEIKNKVLEKI